MLTDKAKEYFDKWLINYYLTNRQDYNQFTNDSIMRKHYRKTEIEKNALIIEWLDSIEVLSFQEILLETYKDNYLMYPLNTIFKEAIEKSNEIYNKK